MSTNLGLLNFIGIVILMFLTFLTFYILLNKNNLFFARNFPYLFKIWLKSIDSDEKINDYD